MTTIDGAFEVLAHAAVQDLGPIARGVFKAIFRPDLVYRNRDEAVATVTYVHLQELSETFRKDTVFLSKRYRTVL